MKKIFLFFALFCGLQTIQAQKDSQAKKVLQATERAFEKGGGISADFQAENFANGQSQGSTTGSMKVKGNKFQFATEHTLTWFDGKTQWNYLKQNDEVNISIPTKTELQSMNPYALLGIYKNGFNYTLSEGSLRGQRVYTVHLTAENKKQDIQEILLDVAQKDYTPFCIRMKQKNGHWTKIVVRHFKNRQKFQEQDFVFPKEAYPHAEIIDMRE